MSVDNTQSDLLMLSMFHSECGREMDVADKERRGAVVHVTYECPACETQIERQEVR